MILMSTKKSIKKKTVEQVAKKVTKRVAKKVTKSVRKKPQRKKVIEAPKPTPIPLDNPTVVECLKQTAGEHGYTVAKTILNEELTDDEIAKKTDMRLNLVRRILYDLYDNRVVSYRRVRDESSGWYIYYWKVEPNRAFDNVNANRRLLLQKLEEQLEREKDSMFFICNSRCPKVAFDVAAENDFKCIKCSGKLEHYDNSGFIFSLEHRVQVLKEQLAKTLQQ